MKILILLLCPLLSSFSVLFAQKNIKGCFQFGLIEITRSHGDTLSSGMREKYECVYKKRVCFDSSTVCIIYQNGENGIYGRYVFSTQTNLLYSFRIDSTGKFVWIDSSLWQSNYDAPRNASLVVPTGVTKDLFGFVCHEYISIDQQKPGLVSYTYSIAEEVPGFPSDLWVGHKNRPSMSLETISIYPEPFEMVLKSGVIGFQEDFDASILLIDVEDYTIISDMEWYEVVKRNK